MNIVTTRTVYKGYESWENLVILKLVYVQKQQKYVFKYAEVILLMWYIGMSECYKTLRYDELILYFNYSLIYKYVIIMLI